MDVTEPLALSAPVAWREAPRQCYRDAAGETCRWYHQVWQYLRLLGVITTVGTNHGFLLDMFRRYARAGDFGRVLIAGSADYAMLARVWAAYAAEGQHPRVTVLDRCPTALTLNRWYAEHTGFAIETVVGDALAYRNDAGFDLICTHNFLGRFDPAARATLVSTWHALLRPGGAIVTTLRVRPHSRDARVVYNDEQARAFAARVADAAREASALDVSVDDLSAASYEYARRKSAFVINSSRDVIALFERCGFEVRQADEGGGVAERERDRPASLAGKDTYRMRVIAVKTA